MNVHLSLVVGGAAAEEISVSHRRFESGRGPEFERLRGLHIIVTVEEDRWLARRFERFGIDERVEICGRNFDGFHAARAEFVRHPLRGPFDIRLVLTFGADAWNAQQLPELFEM